MAISCLGLPRLQLWEGKCQRLRAYCRNFCLERRSLPGSRQQGPSSGRRWRLEWLKAHTAFSRGSAPTMAAPNCQKFQFQGIRWPLFNSTSTRHACGRHTHASKRRRCQWRPKPSTPGFIHRTHGSSQPRATDMKTMSCDWCGKCYLLGGHVLLLPHGL